MPLALVRRYGQDTYLIIEGRTAKITIERRFGDTILMYIEADAEVIIEREEMIKQKPKEQGR